MSLSRRVDLLILKKTSLLPSVTLMFRCSPPAAGSGCAPLGDCSLSDIVVCTGERTEVVDSTVERENGLEAPRCVMVGERNVAGRRKGRYRKTQRRQGSPVFGLGVRQACVSRSDSAFRVFIGQQAEEGERISKQGLPTHG